MGIKTILENSVKPEIYTPGSHIMWTDEYISKQLLQVHLNKDIDLASRKTSTIIKTVDWILSRAGGRNLKILDLGCGPGLYTEQLSAQGHDVTGVDFSAEAIRYARKKSTDTNSGISYRNESYLTMDVEANEYDLAIMIFTDLGVLTPDERKILLGKIKHSLKPGGLFIFDVLNDTNWESKTAPAFWDCGEGAFWSAEACLHLSESFVYEEQKVILYKHIIMDNEGDVKCYHFWTHFLSHDSIKGFLVDSGLKVRSFHEDVLPSGDQFSGKNVTFTVATN